MSIEKKSSSDLFQRKTAFKQNQPNNRRIAEQFVRRNNNESIITVINNYFVSVVIICQRDNHRKFSRKFLVSFPNDLLMLTSIHVISRIFSI